MKFGTLLMFQMAGILSTYLSQLEMHLICSSIKILPFIMFRITILAISIIPFLQR